MNGEYLAFPIWPVFMLSSIFFFYSNYIISVRSIFLPKDLQEDVVMQCYSFPFNWSIIFNETECYCNRRQKHHWSGAIVRSFLLEEE